MATEWTSELWYVHQACITELDPSWQAEREITAFCLGAFNDAICLRRTEPRTKSSKSHPLHSAAQFPELLDVFVLSTLPIPGRRLFWARIAALGMFLAMRQDESNLTGTADGTQVSFRAGNNTYTGTLKGEQIELQHITGGGFPRPTPK